MEYTVHDNKLEHLYKVARLYFTEYSRRNQIMFHRGITRDRLKLHNIKATNYEVTLMYHSINDELSLSCISYNVYEDALCTDINDRYDTNIFNVKDKDFTIAEIDYMTNEITGILVNMEYLRREEEFMKENKEKVKHIIIKKLLL